MGTATNVYVAVFEADTDQVNEFYRKFKETGVHGSVRSAGHKADFDCRGFCDEMVKEADKWQRI